MAVRLDSLEERFLNTIKENNLIEKDDVIVVGVSGGPDSITLLTCLNKYKDKLGIKIVVAHINHLIREDSTEDEQYVENTCKKMGIKFYCRRENILELSKKEKKGTEETGRKVRYEFFDEVAKKENANKIAIAHNMNDNAETILLNLIRGCGLSGLEGIQPSEYKKYIRPLINCERKEIEDYCEKYNLNPRIDYTNKENIYKRNIIRNKILPELKELNPNIINGLSRTSKIVRENNDFVDKYSKNIYKNLKSIFENKINFDVKEFNEQEILIRKRLILLAINELKGNTRNVDKSNIDDIVKLASNNVGNKYITFDKNIVVSVNNKILIFEQK